MAKLRARSVRLAVVLLASLAVAISAGYAWQTWQPSLLAGYYRQQLGQAKNADETTAALQQLLKLGDAGLPPLLDALAAKDETLSHSARQQLLLEIQRWETLSADAATARLAALTHLLADRSEQSPAAVRRFAAELATHILAMPAEQSSPQRAALLVDCERLLKASPQSSREKGDQELTVASWSSDRPAFSATRPFTTTSAEPLRLDRVAKLPGGGLPIGVTNVDPASDPFALPNSSGNKNAPNRLPDSRDALPLNNELASADLAAKGKTNDVKSFEKLLVLSSPIVNAPVSVEAPIKPSLPQELSKMPVRDVIAQLTASDDAQCLRIQAELTRRGFTAVDLALARRLSDTDIQRRKEMVSLLPSLPGVDAKPWLLWLGHDESLEVRIAAATMMATSEDPEMLAWVRELANADSQIAAKVKLR